jgi:hypothetical protein
MKQKWYINRIAFRLLFPGISGLVLYLVLLMVFGNLEDLTGSFLSQEALFLALLTYAAHEWSIFLLGRKQSNEALNSTLLLPKILYFLLMILTTLGITTGIILLYFIYILKYFHFLTELITINILLVLFQAMVHMYYLSMLNIRRSHKLSMENEEMQGQQLEIELESFRTEMNPDLLMECLEGLLTLMRRDTSESENYIQALSNQYRYLLDNRNKEFVDLGKEIKATRELVYLLNGGGSVKLILKDEIANEKSAIIPGTLHNILYQVENSMILSPMNPMEVLIKQDAGGSIRISHENQPRLVATEVVRMDKLNRSYEHYAGRKIKLEKEGSLLVWEVPTIPEIMDDIN